MKARNEIRATVRIALSVAFLCVSAMITVPLFPIPITLQSLALLLVMYLLGAKNGGAALLVYLALGAIGLPVFSGFLGGIGVLFGPTGGFLFGFLFAIPAFWLFPRLLRRKSVAALCAMVATLLALYVFGALWYYFLFAADTSFWAVLTLTVLPFVLPDAVKLSLALLIGSRLIKHLR